MRLKFRSTEKMILCALCAPLLAGSGSLLTQDAPSAATAASAHHEESTPWHSGPLVSKVRRATARFRDINVAISEGWVQGTPCVSGPNSGAMGVHFVKPERLGDGVLDG